MNKEYKSFFQLIIVALEVSKGLSLCTRANLCELKIYEKEKEFSRGYSFYQMKGYIKSSNINDTAFEASDLSFGVFNRDGNIILYQLYNGNKYGCASGYAWKCGSFYRGIIFLQENFEITLKLYERKYDNTSDDCFVMCISSVSDSILVARLVFSQAISEHDRKVLQGTHCHEEIIEYSKHLNGKAINSIKRVDSKKGLRMFSTFFDGYEIEKHGTENESLKRDIAGSSENPVGEILQNYVIRTMAERLVVSVETTTRLIGSSGPPTQSSSLNRTDLPQYNPIGTGNTSTTAKPNRSNKLIYNFFTCFGVVVSFVMTF